MKSGPGALPSVELFISRRAGRWQRLGELLEQVDTAGLSALGRDGILELVRLHRLVSADLNQARGLTANPDLLSRLNGLVGRSYRVVHRAAGPRTERPSLGEVLGQRIPTLFRRERAWVLTGLLALALGALCGLLAILHDPGLATDLIPDQFRTESPAARVAEIEAGPERIVSGDQAGEFAAFLFTHNIQVAFLAFALGAATIAAGWLIMAYNGVILGAVAATYFLDGVGVFFIAWVGPHGAFELPAIAIAGAAGMRLGRAFWLPGSFGREAALRDATPAALGLLGTAAGLLVCAGLIEGSFSQFSTKTIPAWFKIGVAATLATGLLFWLTGWISVARSWVSGPRGGMP